MIGEIMRDGGRPFTRVRIARFVMAIGLAIWGGEAYAQSKPESVRFTVQPGTLVTALIELAVERGFFKDVGIAPELISVANGPAAVTALASGSVDIATNAPQVFNALADKGQSVKLINGQTSQLSLLMGRPNLALPESFPESIIALKGRKIGVTALNSATQYLMVMMLTAARLTASDVQFVAVGASPSQALANGIIDAGFLTGPQLVISQSLGSRVIIDLRSKTGCPAAILEICGMSHIGMWAMGDWIASHEGAVNKVRRAIAKADMFLRNLDNAPSYTAFLTKQIPASSTEDEKAAYVAYALSVLTAAFPKQDLAQWIVLDRSAGVVAGKLDVSQIYADGVPQTLEDVRKLAEQ